MRKYICVWLIFCPIYSLGQGIGFDQYYPFTNYEDFIDVKPLELSSGGYILSKHRYLSPTNPNHHQGKLIKLDVHGHKIDSLFFDSMPIRGMTHFAGYNLLIGDRVNPNLQDISLILIDDDLNIIWDTLYTDTTSADFPLSYCIDHQNNHVILNVQHIVGNPFSVNEKIMVIDSNFNIINQNVIVHNSNPISGTLPNHSITALPNSDYYYGFYRLYGNISSGIGENLVYKINKNTLLTDTIYYGRNTVIPEPDDILLHGTHFNSLTHLNDSTLIIAGQSGVQISAGGNTNKFYLVYTFGKNGEKKDSIALDFENGIEQQDIAWKGMDFITPDSIFVAGMVVLDQTCKPNWDTQSYIALFNINQNGTINWQYYYDTPNASFIKAITATIDGGCLLIGSGTDCSTEQDFNRFLKVNHLGQYVGIDQVEKPLSFLIYPNPTRDKFTVELGLFQSAQVEIYDILGGLVKTAFIQKDKNNIDISSLPRATYIYNITAPNGQRQTGKLIKN